MNDIDKIFDDWDEDETFVSNYIIFGYENKYNFIGEIIKKEDEIYKVKLIDDDDEYGLNIIDNLIYDKIIHTAHLRTSNPTNDKSLHKREMLDKYPYLIIVTDKIKKDIIDNPENYII